MKKVLLIVTTHENIKIVIICATDENFINHFYQVLKLYQWMMTCKKMKFSNLRFSFISSKWKDYNSHDTLHPFNGWMCGNK